MEVLKKSASYTLPSWGNRLTYLSLLLAGIFSALLFALAPMPASTLTSVPTKMNFQGRLADSAGNIKANGIYNMRLKLYTVGTGGSAVWSEDRLVSASQGVTITNGNFSIQLGSITTLPASLFASGALYLEVELPTPASATTSSPVWTEGPMTPRNQMATSAYAYNAETLDGIDSDSFAQVATNNTFTGTNSFNVLDTNAFRIQNGSAVDVFKVDTTSQTVTIGNPGTSTARVYVDAQANSTAMAWTSRTPAEVNDWVSVAHGNGLFVAVAESGTNRVMTSPDGITWTARSIPEANGWFSVTYGNGLFVAVAYSGTNRVMTSPDGITWTARAASEASGWGGITYGNGQFVAVADSGTNRVMTSPDGITWTSRSAAEANNWHGITYANGLYVAVAYGGGTNRVMTSPDGITWTARSVPEANGWQNVVYGNGLFVSVADTGSNRVMTSPDGITWTSRSATAANIWRGLVFGNGLFVAVAYDGTNQVMTSTDGITWTARNSSETLGWRAVTYGNGQFVAVASTGTNRVMTSADIALVTRGAIQINGGVTASGNIRASAISSDAFTILGTGSTNVLLNANTIDQTVTIGSNTNMNSARLYIEGAASTADMKWVARTSPATNQWRSVTYGNGMYVAVSMTGTGNRVMTSPDGITWTSRTSAADNQWRSVTYGNGMFVAVAISGTGNRVMTSPDGITWTARTSAADNFWESVTYGNGMFVAVAQTGTGNRVMTSSDGITWTSRTSAADNAWLGVTYGNGLFVAVSLSGSGNRIMTSPDGITWTSRTSAADNEWRAVSYGNGLFVAVAGTGTGNRVMTSPDGITWTSRTSSSDSPWRSVTSANGLFVAVGWSGSGSQVMSSLDGITWTSRTSVATSDWHSIAYANGLFVAVGNPSAGPGERIMTSGDVALSTRGAIQVNGDISTTGGISTKGNLNVSGNAHFKNIFNSTNAFSIQNVSGADVLKVDTTNTTIRVADVAPLTSATVGSNVSTPLPNSSEYDMTLGSDGFARIVYNAGGVSLNAIQCTNADCTTKVDTVIDNTGAIGIWPAISIGSDGFMRVAYFEQIVNDLIYVQCTNATCSTKVTTTVDSTGNVGGYVDMQMGSDGFARISYADNLNSDLKFAQCTNATCSTNVITIVDSTNVVANTDTSLQLGSDGFARIGYYDDTADAVMLARCTNASCSTNVKTSIESSLINGVTSSIVIDNDTFPRMVYRRTALNDIQYVQCTNADCTTNVKTSLDAVGTPGTPAIALGADGLARISYERTSTFDLRYIQCKNEACSVNANNIVDGYDRKGSDSRIAITSAGYAKIFHRGAENLVYATYLTSLTTDTGAEVRSGVSLGNSQSESFGSVYAKSIDLQGGITIDTTARSTYAPAIAINGPGEYIKVINPLLSNPVFTVSDKVFEYNGTNSSFGFANSTFSVTSSGTGPAAKITSYGSGTGLTIDNDSGGAGNLLTLDNTNIGITPLNITNNGKATFISDVSDSEVFSIGSLAAANLFSVNNIDSRVQIGSATADGTGTVLVLDGKNTAGDPTGTNGAMYYNTSASKFRCYEAGTWKNCAMGQYIPVTMLSTTHVDGQNMFFGTTAAVASSSQGQRKIYFPEAGTITDVKLWSYATTAGSGESWSMYLRKGGLDYLIQTVGTATNERTWANTSMNLTVAAGDWLEVRSIAPTWATNPSGVEYSGYITVR